MNVSTIRTQFPILSRQVNGHNLVYLDSAATTQKPMAVIDAIREFYTTHNANVHRGIHTLGDESTKLYQESRQTVADFLGCGLDEVIFTANTTEALNIVALNWARHQIKKNQVILVSELEHHSNLVVWQEVAKQTGARLEFVKISDQGEIRLDHLANQVQRFGEELFVISLTHLSNVTGAQVDLTKVVSLVREHTNARIVVDAAQSAPHLRISFAELDIDFLACSGHKLYGPMGIGVLIIKRELLEDLKPLYYGGGMIDEVFYQSATLAKAPDRYDAGTPNVAGAVGMAVGLRFLQNIGMDVVESHSRSLVQYAHDRLSQRTDLEIVGPQKNRLGSIAFIYTAGHAHDVAQILDSQGIAVRSGHHCTMPLHEKMGWGSTVRASFGIYSTPDDIDALVAGLDSVAKILR